MAEEKEPLGFGIERFEGFEGFEGFEAFGGSIRQFRASRKRKTWLATAASSAPEKEPLGLPQPQIWQLQEPLWHVLRVREFESFSISEDFGLPNNCCAGGPLSCLTDRALVLRGV